MFKTEEDTMMEDIKIFWGDIPDSYSRKDSDFIVNNKT